LGPTTQEQPKDGTLEIVSVIFNEQGSHQAPAILAENDDRGIKCWGVWQSTISDHSALPLGQTTGCGDSKPKN